MGTELSGEDEVYIDPKTAEAFFTDIKEVGRRLSLSPVQFVCLCRAASEFFEEELGVKIKAVAKSIVN